MLSTTSPRETSTALVDSPEIIYPSSDGAPLAETQEHVWAILITLNLLSQYLSQQQAVVFANPFLYYIPGNPRARVAPDIMVVFDIPPGLRSHYKIWEEGQTPAVIFEMTSASTQSHDREFKRTLYEQLGIQEYWLFDPHADWIPEQLQGYHLNEEGIYKPIPERHSQVLQLRIEPQGHCLDFYRLDTGEKLLTPAELLVSVEQERHRAEEEHQRAERLAIKLRELGITAL
ncbi:MAG: Uma2 family endonuclease [Cyanobacteriota bacterium]